MSLRQKCVLASIGLILIGASPVWSQGLLQTLDPDKDGTVDLPKRRTQRQSYSTSSIAITTALSTNANCAVGSTAAISLRPIPIMTEH